MPNFRSDSLANGSRRGVPSSGWRRREENPSVARAQHGARVLGTRKAVLWQRAARCRWAHGSGAGELLAKEWRQRNEDKKSSRPHSFASIPLPDPFFGLGFRFRSGTGGSSGCGRRWRASNPSAEAAQRGTNALGVRRGGQRQAPTSSCRGTRLAGKRLEPPQVVSYKTTRAGRWCSRSASSRRRLRGFVERCVA